jgi:hypothetical protein
LEILKKIQDLKPGESALSLEFYDRSAQYVLDEYLLDFIDYDTFIGNIDHPPSNHKDYRLDYGGLKLDAKIYTFE